MGIIQELCAAKGLNQIYGEHSSSFSLSSVKVFTYIFKIPPPGVHPNVEY